MAPETTAERGDGFLTLRLERVFDMDLRRLVGMRDWLIAVVVVCVAQITGVNAIGWGAFAALFCTAIVALSLWFWVFPRLEVHKALNLEVAMNAATSLAALALVVASGGASSPYVYFYAVLVVFVAAFVERAAMRLALIVLACLCALAPIAYDWADAVDDNFIPAIVIAVVVWAISAALIALKRVSAVNAELRARKLAYLDPLTGAANRRALDEYAAALVQAGSPYAVAYVRVDGIDEINRAMGHLAGDEALRRVTAAMRASSLDVDQVARVGGVEFAVVLPGSDAAGAERWRARFHERLEIANHTAGDAVAASVGCACGQGVELAELISEADDAAEDFTDMAPVAAGQAQTAAERADHLRELLDESRESARSVSIASVSAPTGTLVALGAALLLGIVIGLTGGASSVLISLAILSVTYFATFGSRGETLLATLATGVSLVAAVAVAGGVSSADQTRALTILVTIAVIADTVQRNSRRLTLSERRAAELSLVDQQTGLKNRRAFERDLIAMIPRGSGGSQGRAEKLDGPPAVIALDIADFQNLRLRLGHAGIELLLLEIAGALRDAASGTGEVYRIGSDEYAVIIRAHHRQHVDDVAARCIDSVRELTDDERYSERGAVIAFRYGGALWSEGMTAADLATAAVAEQPPGVPGGRLALEFS
ncbi:MAG: diguanylate cyclase [Solirubrobacterales bacterium]